MSGSLRGVGFLSLSLLALAFALGRRRIFAEADARLQLGGRLPRRGERQRGSGPERHAALFAADAVLEDPG